MLERRSAPARIRLELHFDRFVQEILSLDGYLAHIQTGLEAEELEPFLLSIPHDFFLLNKDLLHLQLLLLQFLSSGRLIFQKWRVILRLPGLQNSVSMCGVQTLGLNYPLLMELHILVSDLVTNAGLSCLMPSISRSFSNGETGEVEESWNRGCPPP